MGAKIRFNVVFAGVPIPLSDDPAVRDIEFRLLFHGRQLMDDLKRREGSLCAGCGDTSEAVQASPDENQDHSRSRCK
jgi:hypothetical protein